jgi:ATP-dependent exoDNAse (exonuclease V) beta subunit
VRERRGAIAVGLRQAGVTAADLAAATDRVVEALARTLSDPRGRWLFADDHRSACSELALSAAVGGEVVRIVVDRTFVDAAGTRWIVDFKTSAHEGADVEAFLANEVERYRPQLARYARILSRLGPEPIRVGLYHPLLGGWRDWLPTPAELASDWTAPQQSG